MKSAIAREDWDRVTELAFAVTNAVMMDDAVLTESASENFFELLDELDGKYGPHAALLATRGDFLVEDRVKARECLEKALALARATEDREEELEILDSLENL